MIRLFVSIVLVMFTAASASDDNVTIDSTLMHEVSGWIPFKSKTSQKFVRRGCCSHHGGVCGCYGGRQQCCDGTLSPTCTCYNKESVQLAYQ